MSQFIGLEAKLSYELCLFDHNVHYEVRNDNKKKNRKQRIYRNMPITFAIISEYEKSSWASTMDATTTQRNQITSC